MTRTDYDLIPGVNYSTLKAALDSPLAYQDALRGRDETAAMRLGTAEHCAVLEPDRFAREYTANPFKGTTKEGLAWAKAWKASHPHGVILSPSDWHKAHHMAAAVHAHDAAQRYLAAVTEVERALVWSIDGRACKGRVDALMGSWGLLGLKSTRKLAAFPAQAANLHYAMQWAWYVDGLSALGYTTTTIVEIVVESSRPYDVACYLIPDTVLELGREQYREALAVLAKCEREQHWPGAYPGDTILTLPDWAYHSAHPDDEVDEEEELP